MSVAEAIGRRLQGSGAIDSDEVDAIATLLLDPGCAGHGGLVRRGVRRLAGEPWQYFEHVARGEILRVSSTLQVVRGFAGLCVDPKVAALPPAPEAARDLAAIADALAAAYRAEAGPPPPRVPTTEASDCPVCGRRSVVRAPPTEGLARCVGCGLLHRRLSSDAMRSLFDTYRHADRRYFEGGEHVGHGYEHYEEYIELLFEGPEPGRALGRHLARAGVEPGRACDVGAAMGHTVMALRGLGFEAFGVEPSAYARQRALEKHGLALLPGTLADAALADGCLDLVTYLDVFEHVPDPMAELDEIRRVLRPGGALVLELPNQASLVASVVAEDYLFAEHLLFLGPDAAEAMLEGAGLEVVDVYSEHDRYFAIQDKLTPAQSAAVLEARGGERLHVTAKRPHA